MDPHHVASRQLPAQYRPYDAIERREQVVSH